MKQEFLNTLREQVQTYVMSFSENGSLPEMIRLKHIHTQYVVKHAISIMSGENWPPEDRVVGEAAALLHDTGRYSQLREFGTFQDAKSINHAARGVQVIEQQGWLRSLPPFEQKLLLAAVAVHNQKSIPPDAYESENIKNNDLFLRVAHLVRDADKLDIFRVLEESVTGGELEKHPEIAWGLPIYAPPSQNVMDAVCAGQSVQYTWIKTLSDFVMIQVGWLISGLHYATSRRIAKTGGALEFRRNFLKKLSASPEVDRVCDIAEKALHDVSI